MQSVSRFVLAAALIIGLAQTSDARPHRVAQLPNGSSFQCSACHVNPGGGGARNSFGTLVERYFLPGGNVDWSPELAHMDADGDGVTNGEELQDPYGLWEVGQPNPNPAGATHPADAAQNGWRNLTVQFSGMTPHVGQQLGLRVIDKSSGLETARELLPSISGAAFDVMLSSVLDGGSYWVDFYADLNGNGLYDAPPTDHAWRISADDISGNTSIGFSHSTEFTDIDWPYLLTVDLQQMSPHLNQLFEIRVVDESDGMEVGRSRVELIEGAAFEVTIPALKLDHDYRVDFYADLNNNGRYDGTPTDHAWREQFSNTTGDVTLQFSHNMNFTDVQWEYMLRLNLLGMNPHLGQLFELRVVEDGTEMEVGRRWVEAIPVADFSIMVPGLMMGSDYRADFYADLSGNGSYDPPPTDHAWREMFSAPAGNVIINFEHNTNFTDIEWPTLAADEPFGERLIPVTHELHQNYPNPFNPETQISFDLAAAEHVSLDVFDALGRQVATLADRALPAGSHALQFSGEGLPTGMYYYRLTVAGQSQTRRMLLLK